MTAARLFGSTTTARRTVSSRTLSSPRAAARFLPAAPRDRSGVRSGPGIRVCARARRLQGLPPTR
jgi:hypothetical protein